MPPACIVLSAGGCSPGGPIPSAAGIHFRLQIHAPPPAKLREEMGRLAAWMQENENSLHLVVFADQVHKRFVFIYPFIDGNGRVARLLMNLCLLRHGYTLAIIPPVLRVDFIQLLEKAHTEDDSFVEFIAERALETQKEISRMLG